MVGFRRATLIAAACLVAASPLCAATTSYHIGNSLTWDSQPESLDDFAALRGLEHDAGYHLLSATALNEIVAQPNHQNVMFNEFGRFNATLSENAWSAVTMQPNPGATSTLGTDVTAILNLIDLTRSNSANAETKFYIYAAWPPIVSPYQSQWDAPVVDSPSTATVRARQYYDHLIERVRAATDAEVFMVPIGEVLYELDIEMQQGGIPGYGYIYRFFRDGLHLNALGQYTAAATTFATLLREDPRGLTRPAGLFETASPVDEQVFGAINEVIRRVIIASPYSGIEYLDPPRADFDDSGVVDELDRAIWQAAAGKTAVADANGDQIVDELDYLAWQQQFGFDNRRTENFEPEDVNVDGRVDSGDLDIWSDAYGASDEYDLDADGDTDGADFLQWQRAITLTAPADFNRDGVVNDDDLPLWESNYGFNMAADANGDGLVNEADYVIWQEEEGRVWPLPQGSVASRLVPEPAALALAAWALLWSVAGRRFRQKLV